MQVLGHWDLGFYTCLAWTGSDVTLSTASIMHLCAIALHRYHGIAYPLRMRSASETRRVAALVAPAWTIAVALSVPFVVQGVFDSRYVLAQLYPADERLSCGIFNRTFAVYSSLVSFFIPLAVMIVADFRSIQTLRKNIRFPAVAVAVAVAQSSEARRPRTLRQLTDRIGVDDADADDDVDDGSTEIACTVPRIVSSDATSTISVTSPEACVRSVDVQHKPEVDLSANSVGAGVASGEGHGHPDAPVDIRTPPPACQSSFVYRERSRSKSMVYIDMLASCGRSSKVNSRERRAEKTLIWVFGAFVALWLPFFCANLAYGACGGEDGPCNVPPHLFAVFTWLGYMSSGVNPCIYTLLNRDFRAAFRHLLTCQISKLRSAGASTIRANSVRFARLTSLNGSRRRHANTTAGRDVTNVVATPSLS